MLLTENWPLILVLMLFAGAIIGGVFTAFVRFTDTNTSIDTGLLHGSLGVVGILLLLLMILMGREFKLSVEPALGLFVFTAMAGVLLYFIIRRKGILPWPIIFVHAAFAVISLVVLLFGLPF
ncbi:MAG: hypothetical protein OQK98_12740 [Gammaproteobacteria bacterium]|nr:hypothetical protein [Gammaproteobacteria bacterium]